MPGIARTGLDTAGGPILVGANTRVLVEGVPAAVVGCPVAGHAPGPHAGATMTTGSTRVTAGGLPVCRQGDTASCGHPATGSTRVSAA